MNNIQRFIDKCPPYSDGLSVSWVIDAIDQTIEAKKAFR